ncbi:hypothetical protein C0Q70_10896 [Pomacea canaliculata]|uniref:Uncharacterized protein n=1 Tax=Pomacea canaliculata TaxID=400727 RepID=A0A2T7P4G7_POMCA|nr:hypothetical protein C0Q70_10896 [Pomacea canaliculata]
MEPVVRRTTSFNVFCSEKLKANPQGGFQAVEWGNQWRQLTDASKKEYAVKRGSIQDLREKVMAKMSKIAKAQLGLSLFPYERARKGEIIIHGIPPSLMPLQPPGKLATKELQKILDCEVTVTRAPSLPAPVHSHGTRIANAENEAPENTLQQTQLIHESSTYANNEATGSILHEIQTQPLNNTSTHTNITLDINQMSHLINTPEMCDGRTPGHATEGQFQSQLISDSQLITNIEHQPDDGTNTTPVEFPLTEFINAQIIQESEERPPLDGTSEAPVLKKARKGTEKSCWSSAEVETIQKQFADELNGRRAKREHIQRFRIDTEEWQAQMAFLQKHPRQTQQPQRRCYTLCCRKCGNRSKFQQAGSLAT